MAIVEIDGLSEDKGESGFDAIPSGKYNLRVMDVKMKETGPNSKNPGTPMTSLQCEVIDHEEHDGRKIFHNLVHPQKGMEDNTFAMFRANIKAMQLACGITDAGNKYDPDELMHQEFTAVVSVRTNPVTEQKSNQIGKVLEYEG